MPKAMKCKSPRVETCECGCLRSDHADLMIDGTVIDRGHGECTCCGCKRYTFSFTDDDALRDAVKAATVGFDDAANKWTSGKYGNNHEENHRQYRRWKAKENRLRKLIAEMRKV